MKKLSWKKLTYCWLLVIYVLLCSGCGQSFDQPEVVAEVVGRKSFVHTHKVVLDTVATSDNFKVEFVGQVPNCPAVWSWVSQLPQELAPHVFWNGLVSFEADPGIYAAIYYVNTDDPATKKVSRSDIVKTVFVPGLSCYEYGMLAQKELIGGPTTHAWLIAHPDFYQNGTEFLFVADGMAFLRTPGISELFAYWDYDSDVPLTYWNGAADITCAYLQDVRRIQKMGFMSEKLNHKGKELFARNNCQYSELRFSAWTFNKPTP